MLTSATILASATFAVSIIYGDFPIAWIDRNRRLVFLRWLMRYGGLVIFGVAALLEPAHWSVPVLLHQMAHWNWWQIAAYLLLVAALRGLVLRLTKRLEARRANQVSHRQQ